MKREAIFGNSVMPATDMHLIYIECEINHLAKGFNQS